MSYSKITWNILVRILVGAKTFFNSNFLRYLKDSKKGNLSQGSSVQKEDNITKIERTTAKNLHFSIIFLRTFSGHYMLISKRKFPKFSVKLLVDWKNLKDFLGKNVIFLNISDFIFKGINLDFIRILRTLKAKLAFLRICLSSKCRSERRFSQG